MSSINSLTCRFLVLGTESHLLYPSKCELRKVDTTASSLKEAIDGWDRNPLDFKEFEQSHKIVRLLTGTVRVVARALYFLAVTLLISPIGVVYHGLNAAHHFTKFGLNVGEAEKEWMKAADHAKAALRDLVFAMTNFMAGPISFALIQQGSYMGAAVFFSFTNPVPLFHVIGVDFSHMSFNSEKEARAFEISRLFRDHLGLVGMDGKVLPYNESDFESHKVKGLLAELHKKTCNDLMEAVKKVYVASSLFFHFSIKDYFNSEGPSGFRIAHEFLCNRKVKRITPMGKACEALISAQKKLDKIYEMRKEIYNTTETKPSLRPGYDDVTTYTLPKWVYTQEKCFQYLSLSDIDS